MELSTNADIQLVTFFLYGQEYAIDVMRVREISGMVDISKTANSPPHIKGIINLRGSIVPIISLRNCFGFSDLGDESTRCIAVMDLKGELTGFIIDEISDVIRIKLSDILPPPVETTAQSWIGGVIQIDERLVIFLNLEHLV